MLDYISLTQLISFLTATLILNITPGADVMFICGQTIAGGRKHGICAALGISTGIIIYIICTTFGIVEIFTHFPMLFWGIKVVGAIYLLYLAYQAFTSEEFIKKIKSDPNAKNASFSLTFRRGMLTTLLNPKVGLFFLMFMPQFVNIEKGDVELQFLILGTIFVISGTIVDLSYAWFFASL
jgi:threonine/homoserine/homoserine lactone efflux protein